jgi:predicted dehydrogenase
MRAALPFYPDQKFCEAALRVAGTLRVGILGAAFAGEGHAAAYSRLPGVKVTGLWNRTKTRAESLARKLGYGELTVYEDWQSLIGSGSCDVISIATAPMLRSDPLLAALDQGCHVLVEKPISVGVREARIMAAAAEAANTVTACCFNWRYAPAYQTAHEAIRSGQIGAVRDVRTEGYFRARSQFFIDSPWIARMDIANGTLGDGLSHDFDKARYLSGEEFLIMISRITPVTIKQDGDFFVDGGRSMHLAELSGGILAQFCFSITVGEDRFSWLIVGMRDHSVSPTPEGSSCGSDTTTMSRSSWRSPVPTRSCCPPTCSNTPGISSSRTSSGRYATTTRITRATRASPPSPTAYAPKKSSMLPAGRAAPGGWATVGA